jgi:hypothetical protein
LAEANGNEGDVFIAVPFMGRIDKLGLKGFSQTIEKRIMFRSTSEADIAKIVALQSCRKGLPCGPLARQFAFKYMVFTPSKKMFGTYPLILCMQAT